MELVTASDLVVTASLALLLSFLVAKLVSFAMTTDPHTNTTTKHVNDEEPVTLQELRHVSGERLTVQTAQSESKVEFLSPIQVATNLETEHNKSKEEITVESNVVDLPLTSDINVVELPVTSDIAVEVELCNVEEKITEPNEETEELGPQAAVEKTECVEEISVESFTERHVALDITDDDDDDDHDHDDVDGDDDDDDWEGIERSELEKVFMAATEYVVGNGGSEGGDGLASVGSDVQMELYGLHKVATEGPCREPQPMPLKLSARAKWNAWQKLGNMSPEVAMEQYISLVSDKVPGWKKDASAGMSAHETTGSEVSESAAPDLSTSLSHRQMTVTERELEHESGGRDRSPLTESDLENNVKK